MKFLKTNIEGVFIIEPTVHSDKRGYFLESFNKKIFESKIHGVQFVQDNESKSSKGVLRGLHFQKPPYAQAKLVRCVKGEVIDVAVDLRIGSLTYGKHIAVKLTGDNKKQLFVPHGFAHGYVVLSESAVFTYKVDNPYKPDHDTGIRWNDKELNIQWQLDYNKILVSKKDSGLPFFSDLESPFYL